MKNYVLLLLVVALGVEDGQCQNDDYLYNSEHLKIKQISDHAYIHISYLQTREYGNVACNGMIIARDGEAFVFDTPAGDQDSKELIRWIRNELKAKVKGIVATHFHIDCLGGLNEFHKQGIPSFARAQTIKLAKEREYPLPQQGFDGSFELNIGDQVIINEFLGEGHTQDNIISYYSEDQVLFGGCLVKSLEAGKGNLEDADTLEWPSTMDRIKERYPQAEIIIPGHGEPGDQELLDYTKNLFR